MAWRYSGPSYDDTGKAWFMLYRDNRYIGEIPMPLGAPGDAIAEEYAVFIVEACNAYDLVQARERVQTAYEQAAYDLCLERSTVPTDDQADAPQPAADEREPVRKGRG